MSDTASPNPPVTLRRATATMAVGTLVSRITGVGRIVALGYALGTGLASGSPADAYNLSNTIPNIVQDLVLGGILSATFIPVFVARLATREEDDAWEAISAVVSATLIVLGVASVVFLIASPFIIDGLTVLRHAPGERKVATELLILFVPQLACYTFAALAAALLNARGKFGAPTFVPIANNVVAMIVLFAFASIEKHPTLTGLESDRSALILLGLGTSAGVAVQALLLLPSLRRADLHLRFILNFRHEAVETILRLSGWTFGLVVANQLSLLVVLALFDKIAGGVSAYTYAYTFFQLPYGVVTISVMSAVTPDLAARWARRDPVGFKRRWARGLRGILAIVLPAAAGELILAKPLVAVLLGYHASTPAATTLTAQALAMLALGLPGFCIFLYTVRAFQAMQNLRTAFWLYVLENGVNILVAIALVGPMGVRGVALSISIAYTVAAVAALLVLRDRLAGLDWIIVARPLGRVALATIALVAAAAIGSNLSASESPLGLLERVVVGTILGSVAYLAVVSTLGFLSQQARGTRGRRPPRTEPPDPRSPGPPPSDSPTPPAGTPVTRLSSGPSRISSGTQGRPQDPRGPGRPSGAHGGQVVMLVASPNEPVRGRLTTDP
ncbi:MAG: murein biosynthesis integral membrane protein MurJ [Acidimicrobiales bacterium]